MVVAKLSVRGNRLVDPSGKVVLLRGVNISTWEWPPGLGRDISFETRAIPLLCASPATGGWGSNVVRLAVSGQPVVEQSQTYLATLDALTDLVLAGGAYCHWTYRNRQPDADQEGGLAWSEQATRCLVSLAQRWLGRPEVILGLKVEALNVQGRSDNNRVEAWQALREVYDRMVAEIRAVNPEVILSASGIQWGRYVHHALEHPIQGEGILYTSHVYEDLGRPATAVTFRLDQLAQRYQVSMGEFGDDTSPRGLAELRYNLSYCDQYGLHGTPWLFSARARPALLESGDRELREPIVPNLAGEMVRDWLQAAWQQRQEPPPPPPESTIPLPIRDLKEAQAAAAALLDWTLRQGGPLP